MSISFAVDVVAAAELRDALDPGGDHGERRDGAVAVSLRVRRDHLAQVRRHGVVHGDRAQNRLAAVRDDDLVPRVPDPAVLPGHPERGSDARQERIRDVRHTREREGGREGGRRGHETPRVPSHPTPRRARSEGRALGTRVFPVGTFDLRLVCKSFTAGTSRA